MIELTRHIEQLLLHHDCVIVPGLGGFVAQECSARYIEEEHLFLPPYRSVTFNPRLATNDGLLVNEIAQQHSTSYDESMKFIETQVAEIREGIISNGSITLYGIGTFRASGGKFYDFSPEPCGITTPSMFGLDSFCVTPLFDDRKDSKVSIQKSDDNVVTMKLKVNFDFLRYAAVAAVAAVFYFVCISPLNRVIQQGPEEAAMLQNLWSLIVPANQDGQSVDIQSAAKSESHTQSLAISTNAPYSAASAKPAAITENPVPQSDVIVSQQEVSPYYTIVLASAVPQSNAAEMVENWKREGHSSVRIYEGTKIRRVIYGQYGSEDEARVALKKYRSEYYGFDDAWIMEVK